jgi:predicted acyltransferase
MLLVNNVATHEAQLNTLTHAEWTGGVNVADLVFPWFLFIVGVAIPFSAGAAQRKGVTGWQYAGKVLGRALSLVLLGWLVDSSVAHKPQIGLGVLQLIGLAYACGALLGRAPVGVRLGCAAALLLGHWALLKGYQTPNFPRGTFEEDRNVVAYLNDMYLGRWGLKGLISVVPTTGMVLIGTGVGELLQRSSANRRLLVLVGAGAVGLLLGWLWSLALPFNKPVWTGSYILFTAGAGMVGLAVFYLLVDRLGWKVVGFPFVVFGSNAIVAYVLPILVKVHILQEWTWIRAGKPVSIQQALLQSAIEHWGRANGGWAYTVGYIGFWWLALLVLYQRKLFLRV